jgi:hypothetical protein
MYARVKITSRRVMDLDDNIQQCRMPLRFESYVVGMFVPNSSNPLLLTLSITMSRSDIPVSESTSETRLEHMSCHHYANMAFGSSALSIRAAAVVHTHRRPLQY